jgi:ABC-2 type transport system permease protein
MTCLGMVMLIAAGILVYHVNFTGNAFSVLAGFILSSLSFFGIGFILAGTTPNARTAQTVGLVLLYPMMFLSGAFFPIGLLPAAIQKVSAFMPLTFVVNLLRALWNGQPWGSHILDASVLAGMLLVGIIISVKTFRWE